MNLSVYNSYKYPNKPLPQRILDNVSAPLRKILGGREVCTLTHMASKQLSVIRRVILAVLLIIGFPLGIFCGAALLVKAITFRFQKAKIQSQIDKTIGVINQIKKKHAENNIKDFAELIINNPGISKNEEVGEIFCKSAEKFGINCAKNPHCTFTSADPELNEYIKKNFTVYFHNVHRIEDAEIILLGETHTEQLHRIDNGKLINMLCRPQDIVLVESPSENAVPGDQTRDVKVNFTTKGWDHTSIIEQYKVSCTKIKQMYNFANWLKKNEEPVTLDHLINLIRLYPQFRAGDESYFSQQIENDFGNLKQEELRIVTKKILGSVAHEWSIFDNYWLSDTFVDRNFSLVDQINEQHYAGRKVFAIAGLAHLVFVFTRAKPHARDNYKKGVDILHASLKGKKYVILNSKRSGSSLAETTKHYSPKKKAKFALNRIASTFKLTIKELSYLIRPPKAFSELGHVVEEYYDPNSKAPLEVLRNKYSQPLPDYAYA